ncbi:MAG: hypothetical protein GDA46_00660 [Bdellovibrionales bacterium]|nr:hypothetical protein [Bdellovibrionales bacterium]
MTLPRDYTKRVHEINKYCELVKLNLPKKQDSKISKTICITEAHKLSREIERDRERVWYQVIRVVASIPALIVAFITLEPKF